MRARHMHLRRVAATAAAVAAAAALIAACGSDSGGSFAVGDCAAPEDSDPQFRLDMGTANGEVLGLPIEKVDCDDPRANFTITSVDGGDCDTSMTVDDQSLCLGPLETEGPEPEPVDIATLEPGDCTDSTESDSRPKTKLPCDDPRATAEVVEFAEGYCPGDVSWTAEGVTVCLLFR